MTWKPIVPKIVTPDVLLNNLDDYVILDVRRLVEYKAGHIPRAFPCPYSNFIKLIGLALYPEDPDKIAEVLSRFNVDLDTPIVIYDNFYGQHSCRTAYTLELLGFENLGLLSMPFDEYIRRGYPISTETPPISQTHPLKLQYANGIIINAEKIRQISGGKHHDTLLVDTRSPSDYESSHIPGAINIPWNIIYKSNGLFDIEIIRKIANEKDINTSKHLIFYCEEGTSSSFTMYGFRHAGFLNTHTYLPSYPDWLNML